MSKGERTAQFDGAAPLTPALNPPLSAGLFYFFLCFTLTLTQLDYFLAAASSLSALLDDRFTALS